MVRARMAAWAGCGKLPCHLFVVRLAARRRVSPPRHAPPRGMASASSENVRAMLKMHRSNSHAALRSTSKLISDALAKAEAALMQHLHLRWIPVTEVAVPDPTGSVLLPAGQSMTLRIVHSGGGAVLLFHTCAVATDAEIDFALRACQLYRAHSQMKARLRPVVVTLSIGARPPVRPPHAACRGARAQDGARQRRHGVRQRARAARDGR